MSLDAHIRTIIAEAVLDAAKRAEKSKEVMNAEEAREFLGLTENEFKKRRHLIPRREESERKSYYLREDLLEYLRSLRRVPGGFESDYPSDFEPHLTAHYGTLPGRASA